jgi:hypothetical protein
MQKKLNLSEGFSARTNVSNLENLGWDFGNVYKDIAQMKNYGGQMGLRC